MARRRAVLASLASALVAAPAAHAGTYTVHACLSEGTSYDNRSWTSVPAPGILADAACPGGDAIGNSVPARTNPIAQGAVGATRLTAPAGTTIADFTLTRQLTYRNPVAAGTHRLYALYRLGGTAFAGAGDYDNATRNRLNAAGSWYGYPERDVIVPRSTVSRASFPALAAYRGDARTLEIAVGCFTRGSPCSVAAGGGVAHLLTGARVTISDPRPPTVSVEASGLLAGGPRSGSDPVTLDAGDTAGIRRVEIVEVTDGGSRVVGAEDYAAGALSDRGAGCSFRLLRPCPTLSDESVVPTALAAGRRVLKLRVLDAGGNAVEQGPYTVDVATPSDRGPLNGADATEDGTLTARFAGTNRTRRVVPYRRRVRITGRLLNAAGRPIRGAQLRILTRDLRQDARFVDRGGATTGSDGVYRATVRAGASRLTQVAWRSHVRDPGFRANAYVTLKARAAASLRARSRTVGVGSTLRLTGRVRGTVPARGVPLIFQGRPAGGRYATFADGRTDRRGRFRIAYRFRSAASHGRTFTFRVKLRGDARFPYALGYSQRVRVRVL